MLLPVSVVTRRKPSTHAFLIVVWFAHHLTIMMTIVGHVVFLFIAQTNGPRHVGDVFVDGVYAYL